MIILKLHKILFMFCYNLSSWISKSEFNEIWLDYTLHKIRLLRLEHKINNTNFCSGLKNAPYQSRQIAFIRLYEKMGYNNEGVRKFQKLKCHYMKEVKRIWGIYYCSINGKMLPPYSKIAYKYKSVNDFLLEKYRIESFIKYAGRPICKKSIPQKFRHIITFFENSNYDGFIELCASKYFPFNYVFKNVVYL